MKYSFNETEKYDKLYSRESKFLILEFKTDNVKEIIVSKEGAIDSSFDEFKNNFKEDTCFFAIYNVEFLGRDKFLFISWNGPKAKLKLKTSFSHAKFSIKSTYNKLFN